jgi:hypothetical protein
MQERREALAMDINFGPSNDIMTDAGFANTVFQILNTKPAGALWAAPVCSTWVYLRIG